MNGIGAFKVSLGEPVRPMLVDRLSSTQEILEKLGGKCLAEYKYDDERIQAHKQGRSVTLFSQRCEKITYQYPDAVQLIRAHVTAAEGITEAERVMVDLNTGETQPFQELMHRRRKHGIKKMVKTYPILLASLM